MSTKEQIVYQMLDEGTITVQQSELVIALLRENPEQDIAAAVEKAKELLSRETLHDHSLETLNLEELGDFCGLPSQSANSTETIQLNLMDDLQEAIQTHHERSPSIETTELDGVSEASEHRRNRSPSSVTPEPVSRYQTTPDSHLIGEGGMGRVVRVFDTHLGRNIARKELHHSLKSRKSRGGTSIQRRFIREARITAQLEHPGIVPVYEVGESDDGTLYYTMQELSGRTLKDALEECTSLDDRLQLMNHMVDFCQAIGFAHSKGIIHRDIKTENVMIDAHGQTIVLDWGLAKSISESEDISTELVSNPMVSGKTRNGAVMGTPCSRKKAANSMPSGSKRSGYEPRSTKNTTGCSSCRASATFSRRSRIL